MIPKESSSPPRPRSGIAPADWSPKASLPIGVEPRRVAVERAWRSPKLIVTPSWITSRMLRTEATFSSRSRNIWPWGPSVPDSSMALR